MQAGLILPGRVLDCVRVHTDCNLFGALHRRRMSLLGNGVLAEVLALHLGAGRHCQYALADGVSRPDGVHGAFWTRRVLPGAVAQSASRGRLLCVCLSGHRLSLSVVCHCDMQFRDLAHRDQ